MLMLKNEKTGLDTQSIFSVRIIMINLVHFLFIRNFFIGKYYVFIEQQTFEVTSNHFRSIVSFERYASLAYKTNFNLLHLDLSLTS